MVKEYIEAKYGFKIHTTYIAEVKRELGLPMYDTPNVVEELKQLRKYPMVEKVEAIKDALTYYYGTVLSKTRWNLLIEVKLRRKERWLVEILSFHHMSILEMIWKN